jgi:hypothetical protein
LKERLRIASLFLDEVMMGLTGDFRWVGAALCSFGPSVAAGWVNEVRNAWFVVSVVDARFSRLVALDGILRLLIARLAKTLATRGCAPTIVKALASGRRPLRWSLWRPTVGCPRKAFSSASGASKTDSTPWSRGGRWAALPLSHLLGSGAPEESWVAELLGQGAGL